MHFKYHVLAFEAQDACMNFQLWFGIIVAMNILQQYCVVVTKRFKNT